MGPFYKDVETSLYYLNSRYYNPEIGRFINADGLIGQTGDILGHNMYAYTKNNPVMMVDPSGYAPWWSWAISSAKVVGGIALCFVPGAQGIGASLIIGGSLGLIANAVSPSIGQAIGGASSIANGWGAFSTGMSITGLGLPGLIGGIGLMLVGGATMAFGANEIANAVTGTNYIQRWTGKSDSEYGWTYLGLNIASSVGQIAGRSYSLRATREVGFSHDGMNIKGYRYRDLKGNLLYDFDYPHGNIRSNHYHGIPGGDMANRTTGHWNYIELIWWLLSGR